MWNVMVCDKIRETLCGLAKIGVILNVSLQR